MKFRLEASEWCKQLGFVMHSLPAQGRAEKIWSTGILVEASGDDATGKVQVMATDIKQIGMKNDIGKISSVGFGFSEPGLGSSFWPTSRWFQVISEQRYGWLKNKKQVQEK